jgi:hypothetical protein
LQRQLDDALPVARKRADTAEAHLTEFNNAPAAASLRRTSF